MTTIVAPSHICVYHSDHVSNVTASFLRTLMEHGHKGPVILDLRETQYISSAAALMLFAHVNFLHLLYGSRHRVKCLYPSQKVNPNGHRYVVGTQLSRALSSGSLEALDLLVKDKVFFQSSNDLGKHAGTTLAQLTEKLALPAGDQLLQMLGGAIGEAMLNVKHHAYAHDPVLFSGPLAARWWQYARFDEAEGKFIFLIYDLGLGILQTYKNAVTGFKQDEYLMEEALSFGFSRHSATDPSRGCGSDDLKHPINCGETLLIHCDDVRYVYRGEIESGKATIKRTTFNLGGNLLEWVLKVNDLYTEAP
ncbi:hypothetical protein [Aeromonas molluscorum]|uniref:hypothetical protein n=1 Tax=Aeromonas molluscorum TaxID=271417 RepID=UPI003F1B9818